MAELVDAKDLKSFGIYSRPGSSPGEATKYLDIFISAIKHILVIINLYEKS